MERRRLDSESGMIIMPLIMVAPFVALLLFYFLPLEAALPGHIAILIVSCFCFVITLRSMRAKTKSGWEAIIGRQALLTEDIGLEGKVEIRSAFLMNRATK